MPVLVYLHSESPTGIGFSKSWVQLKVKLTCVSVVRREHQRGSGQEEGHVGRGE